MTIQSYIEVMLERKRLGDKSALRKEGMRRIAEQRNSQGLAANDSSESTGTGIYSVGGDTTQNDKERVGKVKKRRRSKKPTQRDQSAQSD